jgi:hypothetical protein
MKKPDHPYKNTLQLDGLVGMVRNVFGTPKESAVENLPVPDTEDVDKMVEDGDKASLDDRRLR